MAYIFIGYVHSAAIYGIVLLSGEFGGGGEFSGFINPLNGGFPSGGGFPG